ncbi:kinase-like domain-containing protein [Flagelloscypha sp. PMI_526]|nr:kinase-like domain-containing protein [Flagelloscypha sp. PMI_526]
MQPTTQPILASDLPSLTGETIASGQLLLCKELGAGSYGRVYLAKELSTGNFFAVKCLPKDGGELTDEYRLHKAVSWSEHIATFHCIFDDLDMTFIVLDYYPDGDLFDLLEKGSLQGKSFLIQQMFLQVAQGVVDMHNCGVYHCDIKPENVLISETGTLHLCDFGLATDNPEPEARLVGSQEYMSPECIGKTTSYPVHNDVWALGILLFRMVTGCFPWGVARESNCHYGAFLDNPDSILELVPELTPEFNTLLKKLFHPTFRTWMRAEELMQEVESIPLFFTSTPAPVVLEDYDEDLFTPPTGSADSSFIDSTDTYTIVWVEPSSIDYLNVSYTMDVDWDGSSEEDELHILCRSRTDVIGDIPMDI